TERPPNASGLRVERVHGTVLAADEHAPACHSRLRPRDERIWKPERPFQLEASQIGRRETGLFRALKPRVSRRRTPSSPLWRLREILQRRRRRAASALGTGDVALDALSGDELGNGATFGAA